MANNDGGYIVFGVTENRPHEIVGMTNNQFEKIEPTRITNIFDEHFSPALKWEHHIEIFNKLKIGMIYVKPSHQKPIICLKSGNRGEYKQGEIYYRYYAKTSLIKYSELNDIINQRIEDVNREWQNLMGRISKSSPSKTAIMDTDSGKIIGDKQILILDNKLLSKIKLIREGEFKEIEGAPVYRIVGDIKDIEGTTIIEKEKKIPHSIHKKDIIQSFLDEKCEFPTLYIKQFPYENTIYLPFWFFIKSSEMSIIQVQKLWDNIQDAQQNTKNKYLNRLNNENFDRITMGKILDLDGKWMINDINDYTKIYNDCKILNLSRTKAIIARERSFIYELIKNGSMVCFDTDFIKKKSRLLLETISNLDETTIRKFKSDIFRILNEINAMKKSSFLEDKFKRCLCLIDAKLNRGEIIE
jgi:hypothetical protein